MRSFSSSISVGVICIILFSAGCSRENDEKVSFKLPSQVINKIIIDNYGTKWIGTAKGLVCFDGIKWNPYPDIPFENITPVADITQGLSDQEEIWLATAKGARIIRFDTKSILSSDLYNYTGQGLLSSNVTAVAADPLNTRFFGTDKGLSIYRNDTWDSFYGRITEEILSEYRISSIAAAKNGWIYAATEGGGVSRFRYTDAVSGATTYDSVYSGLRSNFVNCVIITDDTCQWFGTNHGAAFHFDHFTKIGWKQYTKNDGLVSDTVLCIARDHSGNTWFGTINGLSRLSGEQWTSFSVSDGLPDNTINSIAIDIDGSLWLGTNKGLSHLINGNWINYLPD